MLSRRTLLATAAAGAAVPVLAGAPTAAAPRVGQVLARGLDIPWGMAFLPNGDALVTERRNGRVHRVSRAGGRQLVGQVEEAVDHGEGGLLGVALSPHFAQDRFVYFYVTTATDNRVVRREYVDGGLSGSEVVLDRMNRGVIHNGGRLAFGPDGLLYVSTGDVGHDYQRPVAESYAQDPDNYSGKILRMTPTGEVPPDNPFENHVWSYGHRNVQGLAWDGSGRMWATELGQKDTDELNRIVRGGNYGWPAVEGGDGPGPYADPFVTWSPTYTCSPSGVAVARGRAWVAALNGEALWSVDLAGTGARRKVRHHHERFGRIRTVQKAPDGSLWVATSNGGSTDRVIRLVL